MSPEQAKGRAADKRSDLWAFGCVLYEMLTGQRPFDGEDVSDTLALVLRGEPDWMALPADTPPTLVTLIKRCLDRDPRRRVSSAATALYALNERTLAESTATAPVADPGVVANAVSSAVATTRRSLVRTRIIPLAAAAVLAVGAALFFATRQPPRAALPVARTVVEFPGAPPTGRGVIAISADGQQLAYVSNFRLFVRRFGLVRRQRIATGGTAGTTEATFSPDGRSLVFYSGGALHRVSLSGGAPTPLCMVDPPLGLSWQASGILVGQAAKGLYGVPRTADRLKRSSPSMPGSRCMDRASSRMARR